MTVNLLQAGGYFLFSGVGNFGDSADALAGLTMVWLCHAGLSVFWAVSYVLGVWLALLELRPFFAETDWRRGRAKDLTKNVPYVTGVILYATAFQPRGHDAARALGGGSLVRERVGHGMDDLTGLGSKFALKSAGPRFIVRRNRGWVIAAGITASIFIGLLGRGIRFS